MGEVRSRCYSRVGFLGNPSDGYFGQVISFSLQNFFCEVTLKPSDTIKVLPNLEEDGFVHSSLEDLSKNVEARGYTGGLHLLLATCKVFQSHCSQHVKLPSRGFLASYTTNIPRQCGLSGSSAIVLAALDCLIRFYHVSNIISLEERPDLALAVETELGITAGLQDRIIQTYGGMLYMDFSKSSQQGNSKHHLVPLDYSRLPDLYIIYSKQPSNSGAIHSDVKERWRQNAGDVRSKIESIAGLASEGRLAIEQQDWGRLRNLMDTNFNLRRLIFGDRVLGEANLRMVEIARSHGGSAKLTGSGGAVIALFMTDDVNIEKIRNQYEAEGYTMVKAEIASAGAPDAASF